MPSVTPGWTRHPSSILQLHVHVQALGGMDSGSSPEQRLFEAYQPSPTCSGKYTVMPAMMVPSTPRL